MANNNDGQIVLGLDIPKTVSQINDDIKKLEKQLEQVKATGALDTSATVKQINAQISALQSQLNTINIKTNIDTSSVKKKGSSIASEIFNTSDLDKQGKIYFTKTRNTIDKMMPSIESKFKGLGFSNIEVKGIEDATGKIKSFAVTASDAEGAIKKFNFEREKLQGSGKAQYGFVQSEDVQILKTASQAQEKLAQSTEKANAKLAEQANKIQLQWGDGSYEAKYDSLIAKTKQWVNANDESVISTQKLTEAYNEFNKAASNYANDNSVANRDALIQKEEELARQIKATTNEVRSQNAEYAKSSKIDSLHQQIQEFYDKNTASHRKWGAELQDMLNKTAHGANLTNEELAQTEARYRGVINEARQAGKLGDSFWAGIKKQANSFLQWFSVTSVITSGIHEVKKLAQEVIAVDTAMVELTKVSSASNNELANYFDEAAESAKDLGASISDVISSTADFSRLGYNLPDASELAKVATLYKNVGDGINIDQASSSIVSTMKAFDIEAENAIDIVDKFNEVGNNFAISSGEIGDALSRSASSLSVAGNSLSESIGLITAGNTIVQDADTVGTALKSMSLRITSTSAELEAMGEDTEFACETLSDYRDLVMGLTDNKVNIIGDDGEYKSTYQILKEISNVWEDMNSMEQSSLMKALFGVRQANIGASILENFDVAEEAMKSAEGAAGSALKEQENYEKGIQYSLDRLEASYQEFANHILDSDLIKGIVDFGNTAINVLDDVTSALGGLGTIGLGAGLFAGIKNVGIDMLVAC